jgi:TrkA domain protein
LIGSRESPELLSDDEPVEINEVLLPGVGLRYEFTNHEGERIGVIARRTGEFELVVYGKGDPDASRLVVRLNSQEAETVAEILGAPRMAERFADLTKEVPGLVAAQVRVSAGSPFANQPLGQTRARTRTGASIVAIVRGEDVIASPTPNEVLRAGDVLVVIGTHDGIAGVQHIVRP